MLLKNSDTYQDFSLSEAATYPLRTWSVPGPYLLPSETLAIEAEMEGRKRSVGKEQILTRGHF